MLFNGGKLHFSHLFALQIEYPVCAVKDLPFGDLFNISYLRFLLFSTVAFKPAFESGRFRGLKERLSDATPAKAFPELKLETGARPIYIIPAAQVHCGPSQIQFRHDPLTRTLVGQVCGDKRHKRPYT